MFCQTSVPEIDKTDSIWPEDGDAEKETFWNGTLILNLQNVQSRKPFQPSSQIQFPKSMLQDPFSLQWLSFRQ